MECPVKALLESLADSARYCRFVDKTLNEEFETHFLMLRAIAILAHIKEL